MNPALAVARREREPVPLRHHRRRLERRLIAATALGLLVAMRAGPLFGLNPFRLLAALLGGAVLLGTLRNPMVTARFAIVWIPLSPVVLSLLLNNGVPGPLVKIGTYVRSMLVLCLLIAGWRHRRAAERPLEAIDRLALGYLGIVVTYLLAGPLISDGPISFTIRLQGLQAIAIFVCAFLAVRWLDPSLEQRDALRRWATGIIAFLALLGLYQRVDQTGFNRLMFDHIGIGRYFREIAELSNAAYSDATAYFFAAPLRITSLSLNPFGFADLMLCGVAIAVVGLTHRARAADVALAGVCSLAIFFTDTRISILAMGAVVATAVAKGRVSELAKLRFVVVIAIATVALLPMIVSSRLVQTEDNAFSDEGHGDELIASIESIVERPLGSGIGSDGAVARRAAFDRPLVSGNAVLSLGMQVGLAAMVVFVAFFVTCVRQRRGDPGSHAFEHSLLALLLLVGSLVSAMTHNNWQEAAAGPMTWLLIGLGSLTPERAREP